MTKIIPAPAAVLKEGLIILGGTLLAAWAISRIPAVRAFVQSNSLTVKDQRGTVLY